MIELENNLSSNNVRSENDESIERERAREEGILFFIVQPRLPLENDSFCTPNPNISRKRKFFAAFVTHLPLCFLPTAHYHPLLKTFYFLFIFSLNFIFRTSVCQYLTVELQRKRLFFSLSKFCFRKFFTLLCIG